MLTRHTLMASLLLSGLLAIQSVAHAAPEAGDDSKSGSKVRIGAAPCTDGTLDCQRAVAAHIRLAHAGREDICAKGDQTCDTRGKEARARHADESRDRHACRD
jgi:hypothetical protein